MAKAGLFAKDLARRLVQTVRRRLVRPILDSRHPPEHTARGVFVGILVAMTPTIGIQMPIVFAIWLAARALRRSWDFNLIIGLAWTWTTNVFTAAPIYYLFMITGRVMLGRWDEFRGYRTFSDRLDDALVEDDGWLETMRHQVVTLFDVFGVPLFVGCVPWSLAIGFIAYFWALRLVRMRRHARERRGRASERLGSNSDADTGSAVE